MKYSFMRIALCLTVVFGALVLIRSAHFDRVFADDDARAAIDKLHQQDITATLARDPKALADLFSDTAVLLEPGQPAIIGRAAILAENEQEQKANPNMKIVSYKPDIRNLEIRGNCAYEWDTFEASYKESDKGEVKSFRAKALRVLERQSDGSWKFSRVMWNTAEGQ
jgi:uncharacterized protein (TIGR02246 family)